jgi:hypothetical protein
MLDGQLETQVPAEASWLFLQVKQKSALLIQVPQEEAQAAQVPSLLAKVPSGQLSIHWPLLKTLPGVHLVHLTSENWLEELNTSYEQAEQPRGQVSQTPLSGLATSEEPEQTPDAGTVAIPTHCPPRKKVLAAQLTQSVFEGPLQVAQAALHCWQVEPEAN